MAIILCFLTIIVLFVSVLLEKKLFNPIVIINIWWLTLSVLGIFNINNLIPPSTKSLAIIMVGIFFINVGYYLYKIIFIKYNLSEKISTYHHNMFHFSKYNLHTKIFQIITYILILYFIYKSIAPINMLLAGNSISEVRDYFYLTAEHGLSEFVYYIENYLVMPLFYVVIVINAVLYFFKDKKVIYFISTILLLAFYSLSTGGRYMIVNTLIVLFFAYILSREKNRTGKVKSGRIIIAFVVLFSLIVIITNNRQVANLDLNLIEYADLYFRGSISFLSKIIETIDLSVSHTYGLSSFSGILSPFISFLTYLNIIEYPAIFNTIASLTSGQIQIGNGIYYNAFSTIFLSFYVDFGFLGVIFGSLIFGYISSIIYMKIKYLPYNMLVYSIFLLFMIQVNNTSLRFMFNISSYVLAFIYLRLFFVKRRLYIYDTLA